MESVESVEGHYAVYKPALFENISVHPVPTTSLVLYYRVVAVYMGSKKTAPPTHLLIVPVSI